MIISAKPLALLAVIATAGYCLIDSTVSRKADLPKETPSTTVTLVNLKQFHNVQVVRRDSDGFVISSAEGTFKVYKNQISPETLSALEALAVQVTPTPAPMKSSMKDKQSLMKDNRSLMK